MIRWLVGRTLLRVPRRLVLEAVGVALPVAMLGATLLFVDGTMPKMTRVALEPVQVEMRALAAGLGVDINQMNKQLAAQPDVKYVDPFASADIITTAPGAPPTKVRLFAIDPVYVKHHPWVHVVKGSLGNGQVLLAEPLRAAPGFAAPTTLTLQFSGDAPPLTLPVGGTVDLRNATTWFAIPTGGVQGDIAVVPNAVVVDYKTFEVQILPALRSASAAQGGGLTNPGLTDLPPVTVEAHLTVPHSSYPHDPVRAALWSGALRRQLEQRSAGAVVVADNAGEFLTLAGDDANNAKILFLLLGLPGALAAGALGLAAASALIEARRREDALLELRGATPTQMARLSAASGVVATVLGAALGLGIAAAAVWAVLGHPPWDGVPAGRLLFSAGVAVLAGVAVMAIRVVPRLRATRQPALLTERRLLFADRTERGRRTRLGLLALVVGAVILAINAATGGLKPSPVEGQAVALSFWVLLAPIAIWLGATVLAGAGLQRLLARRTRPDRPQPLGSWSGAALRWLSRRPARAMSAVLLGILAVAFSAEVLGFVGTYRTTTQAEARAALGADLRLTPPPGRLTPPPKSRELAATTPIRLVPSRIGTDRKTLKVLDLKTYATAARPAPSIVEGGGLDALASGPPNSVLISKELATDGGLHLGDPVVVTVYPDAENKTHNLTLTIVGIYRSLPPDSPVAEATTTVAALPAVQVPYPDFFLADTVGGQDPDTVATHLAPFKRQGFRIETVAHQSPRERRTLASLNLTGISQIEAVGATLIASLGIGVLGGFLLLERRRELAVLQTVGADRRQLLLAPALEMGGVVVASLAIGMPLGLGLSVLAIRVLGLFFLLPPPVLSVPVGWVLALVGGMLLGGAAALTVGLGAITRIRPAEILREP